MEDAEDVNPVGKLGDSDIGDVGTRGELTYNFGEIPSHFPVERIDVGGIDEGEHEDDAKGKDKGDCDDVATAHFNEPRILLAVGMESEYPEDRRGSKLNGHQVGEEQNEGTQGQTVVAPSKEDSGTCKGRNKGGGNGDADDTSFEFGRDDGVGSSSASGQGNDEVNDIGGRPGHDFIGNGEVDVDFSDQGGGDEDNDDADDFGAAGSAQEAEIAVVEAKGEAVDGAKKHRDNHRADDDGG